MSDENIAFYTNIFDEIKNKVSLVSEIEKRGVPLFNSGQNRKKCRCPFHNDRTPSFFVYLEGDIESYYCFGGCGGGSVIDFVMNYDKLDLTQAIKYFSEN
ncbi:MAG: CHC2 zinc finger domain-containing protein, partial [bacterium]|nr:CHC2 zinc finger domain-containing protein [bacterium]